MAGLRGNLGFALAVATALFAALLLLAAPAFADAKARNGTVRFVDCDRLQSAQIQYSTGNSGNVDQDVNVTQTQELECAGDSVANGKDVLSDTIVKGVLPDTGGTPVLAASALILAALFASAALFVGRRR